MKPRDPAKAIETRNMQRFIDAMREVLDYPPLYASDYKPVAERFQGAAQSYDWGDDTRTTGAFGGARATEGDAAPHMSERHVGRFMHRARWNR